MSDTLVRLLTEYGYLVVLLVVAAEGVGVPLPGETALVTAAALAARGRLSIVGVVAAAALGGVLGGSGGYWIGQTGGLALVRRHGRWLRLDEAKLARARAFFERHGAGAVFLGRFVALLRILAGVLAGVAAMPFARFSLYNALGAVAWSATFGAVGYLFGRNLPWLEHEIERVSLVAALLAAAAVAVVLARRARPPPPRAPRLTHRGRGA